MKPDIRSSRARSSSAARCVYQQAVQRKQQHRRQSELAVCASHDRGSNAIRNIQQSCCAAAVATLLCACTQPAANADSLKTRLPLSNNLAVASAQREIVDAWNAVDDLFVDSDQLVADNFTDAINELHVMLMQINDPYTRVAPRSVFQDYKATSEGQLSGVGLLLAGEHDSKRLVVVAPMSGGPADRAGIQRGDVVTAIDGTATADLDAQAAGDLLRGKSGSQVKVQVVRPTDAQPGVAARPGLHSTQARASAPALAVQPAVLDLTLRREAVQLASVQSMKVAMGGLPLGYIRLDTFTSTSGHEVQQAVRSLSSQGVKGFVLDLRDNPGGILEAALDTAHAWLPGDSVAFNISGRDNELKRSILLEPGPAVTELPLAVLVNGQSASASEILAGALRDHGRAQLVGDADTFGKGKIQTVYELQDGSALYVTVARYQTPARSDIDQVGLRPDRRCRAAPFDDDSTVDDDALLAAFLPPELRGAYGGPPPPERLFADPCFMAAGKVVSAAARHPSSLPRVPQVVMAPAPARTH